MAACVAATAIISALKPGCHLIASFNSFFFVSVYMFYLKLSYVLLKAKPIKHKEIERGCSEVGFHIYTKSAVVDED